MAILFEVLDVSCQQSDNSFFKPNVILSTKSTTTFAVLRGYNEFGTPSSPPKKYRTITFSGSSKRVAFTGEEIPRQTGGASYVYDGVGQIDFKGNQLSNYTKKFFAQCSKAYWPLEPLQTNDRAIQTGTGVFSNFVSFCWPTVPQSCATCDPNEANWAFLGNQAVNEPTVDLQAFIHGVNDPVVTKTSWSVNDVFHGLTSIELSEPWSFVVSGHTYNVTVGPNVYGAQSVVTNPTPLEFPVVAIQDSGGNYVAAAYIIFTDTNNYSAVLSDEYTDADALANATLVNGTGATASNLPRANGFTSQSTSVVYTLSFSNLIKDRDYVATVDLWDQPTNSHTIKTYAFTAPGVTHSLIDTVPTPAAGHVITVSKPLVSFAP